MSAGPFRSKQLLPGDEPKIEEVDEETSPRPLKSDTKALTWTRLVVSWLVLLLTEPAFKQTMGLTEMQGGAVKHDARWHEDTATTHRSPRNSRHSAGSASAKPCRDMERSHEPDPAVALMLATARDPRMGGINLQPG